MDKKKIFTIRAANLDRAIGSPGKHGRIADFARAHNLNPAYISHVLNGRKNLGEDLARVYEEMLGLPKYGLDEDGSEKSNASGLRPDQAELVERYESLPPEAQKAFLVFLESLERH